MTMMSHTTWSRRT